MTDHYKELMEAVDTFWPHLQESWDVDALQEAAIDTVMRNERRRIDWLLWKLRYVMKWPILRTHGATLQPYFDVFCDVGRSHVLGRECDFLREKTKDEVRYISVLTGNHQVPHKVARDGSIIRFIWKEKPEAKWAEGVFQTAPPNLHEYVMWAEAGTLLEKMNNFRGI